MYQDKKESIPETMNRQTFASLIGVSAKTLYIWDKKGTFCSRRTPSGRPFYTREDYDNYLKGCCHQ